MKKLKESYHFLQGWIRYYMYYSPFFSAFLRSHIKEQIEYRINSMNKACYFQGSCIKCGCTTTALQMCNKPCEGDCYPRMMNRLEWMEIIHTQTFNIFEDKGCYWKANTIQRKFDKIELTDVERI